MAPATPAKATSATSPGAEPGWVLARRRAAANRLKWWMIGAAVILSAFVAALINQPEQARVPLVAEAQAFASAVAERAGLPAPRFETDAARLLRHGMPHADWGGTAWFFVRPISSPPLAAANELSTNPSCPAHSVTERAPPGAGHVHYAIDCTTPVPLVVGQAESASVVSRSAGGIFVVYYQRMDGQKRERLRLAIDAVMEDGAF